MINDKIIVKNLKIITYKLKNNKYFFNKKIFIYFFIKKKNILEKINFLYKKKKINKKNILKNFFIKKKIKIYKNYFKYINNKIKNIILNIPNIKNSKIKNNNKIIKYWKCKKIKFKKYFLNFENIGIDLKNAKNISGIKSSIIKNPIIYLYKAIIKYIINIHIKENNYKEIKIPFIISYNNIINSGQLPKFIKNLFILNKKKYLIPTAEVIMINIIKNKNINKNLLPIKIFSITECFRKENNYYGKKNKGLIRQNQFEKIEIINFSDQKNSYNNLKEMVKIIEKILKKMKLSYRVILLSKFNTGFTASKTFDIEIWIPSLKNFCEISSCSNTEIFQSLNTNIKYKYKNNNKFLHILNASALPLGRTLIGIIENNIIKKKYIIIPRILRKYMNKKKILKI